MKRLAFKARGTALAACEGAEIRAVCISRRVALLRSEKAN